MRILLHRSVVLIMCARSSPAIPTVSVRAELRRFMKGQHPWRNGESVQVDDGFDASKIQHVLEHMDSDCVDKAPEVSSNDKLSMSRRGSTNLTLLFLLSPANAMLSGNGHERLALRSLWLCR